MLDSDKLHARGPRGEACIIVRTTAHAGAAVRDGARSLGPGPGYHLATGERLIPTELAGEFETLDGKRRFTLI
jgi:hypothetical protein